MVLLFLLTHLLRGATGMKPTFKMHVDISTHAPLARCDIVNEWFRDQNLNFYSRTSCEVRLTLAIFIDMHLNFYSRTSCEVRRLPLNARNVMNTFLLTHLLRGATSNAKRTNLIDRFLLTHLLRGATATSSR